MQSKETRYFSDFGGETIEIDYPRYMPITQAAAEFPGARLIKIDSFKCIVGVDGKGNMRPITRKIAYRCRPALHECNAKCRSGKRNGTCECQCGGKFHGITS